MSYSRPAPGSHFYCYGFALFPTVNPGNGYWNNTWWVFLGGAGQFQPSRHSMSSQCLNLLSCSQHDGVLLVQNIEPPKLGKVNLPHQIEDIQIENLAIAF